ncbi:hypothetical protein MUG91_G124n37 [Manis pentadactyla]|nr:hypothetical protein MUG91_G124n37 [Manis pentadactyla]
MFAKQFKHLTQAYKLIWHDVHVVLQSTLTPEEYDHVMAAAQHCANEAHATDEQEPMGREAIPLQEPLWDYNSPEGSAGGQTREHSQGETDLCKADGRTTIKQENVWMCMGEKSGDYNFQKIEGTILRCPGNRQLSQGLGVLGHSNPASRLQANRALGEEEEKSDYKISHYQQQ